MERQILAEFDFVIAHDRGVDEMIERCKKIFLEYLPEAEKDPLFDCNIRVYVSALQDLKFGKSYLLAFIQKHMKGKLKHK